jgi:hypothetical protein
LEAILLNSYQFSIVSQVTKLALAKTAIMYYPGVYIGGIKMIRTQIYLTEQQRFALNKLSSKSGKKQSELIREAVDTLIFPEYGKTEQIYLILINSGILGTGTSLHEEKTSDRHRYHH